MICSNVGMRMIRVIRPRTRESVIVVTQLSSVVPYSSPAYARNDPVSNPQASIPSSRHQHRSVARREAGFVRPLLPALCEKIVQFGPTATLLSTDTERSQI